MYFTSAFFLSTADLVHGGNGWRTRILPCSGSIWPRLTRPRRGTNFSLVDLSSSFGSILCNCTLSFLFQRVSSFSSRFLHRGEAIKFSLHRNICFGVINNSFETFVYCLRGHFPVEKQFWKFSQNTCSCNFLGHDRAERLVSCSVAILAQGHFIQTECENLVSPSLDGLIRWESVERRTRIM